MLSCAGQAMFYFSIPISNELRLLSTLSTHLEFLKDEPGLNLTAALRYCLIVFVLRMRALNKFSLRITPLLCRNDSAVSPQVRPLMGLTQQVSSYAAPSGGPGCYETESIL